MLHAVGPHAPHATNARRRSLALVSLLLAAFVVGADITITNVALPAIAEDLDASVSALQWVVDSYNIAVAGLLLLGAGLGERFSRKWVFLGGLLLFLAGSLMAGVSTSVGGLVGARTAMGVGAALVLSPAISLIAAMYPPEQRTRPVAAWAAAGSIGLAVGPIAAGLLLTVAEWPWVFLVNLPLLLLAVGVGAWALPPGGAEGQRRLDLVGALLSVAGLALLLGAVIEAPVRGWLDPVVVGAALAGVAATTGFVLWELHRDQPMFEVRVLANRSVAGAAICLFASYAGFTGVVFLMSQQLEVVEQVSSAVLGLCLVPFALALWGASASAARITQRIGAPRSLLGALLAMTAAFVGLAAASGLNAPLALVAGSAVVGASAGLLIPIGSVVILNALPAALTGSASGTSMLARFAGASFGVAVLGTVLAMTLPAGPAHADPVAFDSGVRGAYLAGAVILGALTVAQAIALRGTDVTPPAR